jgi:hypothetical protein
MGEGVGKMFGIGNLFGGVLDSIGLGALKPVVSMAFDFATGNIPGLIGDITSLMSSFKDGGFTNNVANNQPLPEAFNPQNNEYNAGTTENNEGATNACGCQEENGDLSKGRIGDLFKLLGEIFSAKDGKEMMTKLSDLFKLLSEQAQDRQTIQDARTNSHWFAGGSVETAA